MLDFTVNQGFVACYGSPPPPLPGGLTSVGPAGFPSPGGWGMVVRLDSQPAQYALTSPVAGSDTATVYIQGPGALRAGRPYGVPPACGSPGRHYNPGYHVTGS